MTTGAAERRITDVADAAVRARSRARATLGVAPPVTVAYYALRRDGLASPALFVYAWVAAVACGVGVHTLIHGYHYGHREGRRSA